MWLEATPGKPSPMLDGYGVCRGVYNSDLVIKGRQPNALLGS